MIAALRDQLAEDLRSGVGVPVFTTWTNRVNPPAVLLVPPSGGYVAGAGFGGQYTVSLDAVLLVTNGSNALDELNALIESTLTHSADWSLTGVDGPSVTSVGGIEFLGTIAHIHKSGRLA